MGWMKKLLAGAALAGLLAIAAAATVVGYVAFAPVPRFQQALPEVTAATDPEAVARFDERFGEGQRHPVLARHPRTGDEVLFVNWGFTRYLVGSTDYGQLLDELFALFGDPAIQFEYSWTEGDLVIWDEHRTVHRGPADFGSHRREVHRCTFGRHVPTTALDARGPRQ